MRLQMLKLWFVRRVPHPHYLFTTLFYFLLLICIAKFLLFPAFQKGVSKFSSVVNVGRRRSKLFSPFLRNTVKQSQFLLNSSKCQIPNPAALDRDIASKYYTGFRSNPDCSQEPNLPFNLTFMKGNSLHVDRKWINDDIGRTCCYNTVDRVEEQMSSYGHTADNGYNFSKECHPLKGTIIPIGSFIKVTCEDPEEDEPYANFHLVPIETTAVKEKAGFWKNCKHNSTCRADRLWNGRPPPNVLIIGLDSTSRLNFRRTMPNTLDVLENQLKAVEMKGYTKVGENTFPNIIPLLTSFFVEELQQSCYPSRWSALDNCPFIWKEFSQRNYLTAFLPDCVGTFNYYRTGFVHAPVDIYSIPLLNAAKGESDTEWLNACLEGHRHEEDFLEYVTSLATMARSKDLPYFLITWFSLLTHDNPNGATKLDTIVARALLKLQEEKLLDYTALFLMGDHGYRFHDYRTTPSGWYEEKLPVMWVKPPIVINGRSRSSTLEKLKLNAEKVTTPFDIHATLRDILNLPWNSTAEAKYRGVSLFKRVPDRTCKEAGVPPFYCPCTHLVPFNGDQSMAIQAGKAVVNHINSLIPSVCVPLSLQHIFATANATGDEEGEKGLKLLIGFITQPGNFRFEALVAFHKEEPLQVLGLTRTNTVDNMVQCLERDGLRNEVTELYCRCKS